MTTSIDVLECTHGNELLGLALDEQLKREPIPGVRSRIAHPEAVRSNVRYIGQGPQLQMHYPGNPFGDPEDRAAYKNMQWLGTHVSDPQTLIYDIHNSNLPNLTNFSVGRRASQATMVGAWLLGYDKCYLLDDPFRRAVPNAVLLETSVAHDTLPDCAKRIHKGLGDLALMDVPDLLERYAEMTAHVQFFTKHELYSTTEDGSLLPIIPSLEAIPGDRAFTPLDLSAKQRVALHIPETVDDVLAETWGHQNMSKILPHLGETADGKPRRVVFGSYYLATQPPTPDGVWAVHTNMPSM